MSGMCQQTATCRCDGRTRTTNEPRLCVKIRSQCFTESPNLPFQLIASLVCYASGGLVDGDSYLMQESKKAVCR